MKTLNFADRLRPRALPLLFALCLPLSAGTFAQTPTSAAAGQPAAAARAKTPSETLRAFYAALGEKRFREAFELTIWWPAIKDLKPEEFEELRPDFERIAAGAGKYEITGEQISNDVATVFVRLGEDPSAPPEPQTLLREGAGWLVGDRENQQIVQREGRDFFFNARVRAHEADVKEMFQRISVAQFLHAGKNGGLFTDLETLVREGLVPRDILTPDTTGYRFHVTPTDKGKGYAAGAEPVRYGRTGRLSFYLDQTGAVKSEDKGGKPLKGSSKK